MSILVDVIIVTFTARKRLRLRSKTILKSSCASLKEVFEPLRMWEQHTCIVFRWLRPFLSFLIDTLIFKLRFLHSWLEL